MTAIQIPTKTMKRSLLLILFPMLQCLAIAQSYPPVATDIRIHETNLPIVFINTLGHQIDRDEHVSAYMKIVDNPNGLNYDDTIAHPHQPTDYEGYIGIKYRGNSSFTYSAKKPYSIKLLTDSYENNGAKRKASLLGMGKDNDWCLLAPYNDRSLLRNTLSLSLAQGYLDYVPQTRFCELILDGIYYGVHSLTERVRTGSGRLNIKSPGDEGDALTGGYIICVDRNDEPLTHASQYHPTNSAGDIFTDKTIWVQYTDPSWDEITEAQRAYIDSRFDAFEDALASPQFMDADKGYRQHIDVTSFIDYQLSTEIANNIDGYRLSTYLYKHRDSVDPRFKMTLWDLDLAWGLPDFENIHTGYMTDIWTYKNNDAGLGTKMPFWFDRLMHDPSYVAQLKARYADYRQGRYADVPATVDSLATLLTAYGAAQRDHQAWPRWGEVIFQNYYLDATTYAEEVAYVRNFAAARIAWLDQQLGYDPASISTLPHPESMPQAVYSADGVRRATLQPGLNIVRYSDGTTRKIVQDSRKLHFKGFIGLKEE